jgi:uncharacterized MAPEG superfamily protein
MQEPFVAYWILLAAALMPYPLVMIAKANRDYDNTEPRDPAAINTPLRRAANGAHQNGLEAFPLLAAAVLLAGLRHAPAGTVNLLAGLWLAFRLVYVGCYLTRRGSLRSLAWSAASACSVAIFVIALTRGSGI